MANRKELSEVTGLDKIGLSNRLHHMISFDGHLCVAVDDVPPSLISKRLSQDWHEGCIAC